MHPMFLAAGSPSEDIHIMKLDEKCKKTAHDCLWTTNLQSLEELDLEIMDESQRSFLRNPTA